MKRLTITLLTLMFALTMPMAALAMSHESHEGHDHGKSDEKMHQGHEMESHGDMKHDDMGKHKGHDMHMEHAKEKSHDMHKGHEMTGDHSDHGGLQAIGEKSEDGVKAVAKIKAYDANAIASMEKMGMSGTHHLMVFFTQEQGGAEITEGKVALKIKGPGDEKSKPIELMKMGNGFGADVALKAKGHYELEVGTKLKDGKTRKFEFHQMVE